MKNNFKKIILVLLSIFVLLIFLLSQKNLKLTNTNYLEALIPVSRNYKSYSISSIGISIEVPDDAVIEGDVDNYQPDITQYVNIKWNNGSLILSSLEYSNAEYNKVMRLEQQLEKGAIELDYDYTGGTLYIPKEWQKISTKSEILGENNNWIMYKKPLGNDKIVIVGKPNDSKKDEVTSMMGIYGHDRSTDYMSIQYEFNTDISKEQKKALTTEFDKIVLSMQEL